MREHDSMKAMVYDSYGTPAVLRIESVDIPDPKDHEVLIEVHAASVNSWDWDLLRGKPFINRLGAFRTPRYRILGADIAGKVIAVGAAATRFKPGDEVFGDLSGCGWGGFAEYVCAAEGALTPKPARVGFIDAAAIPQAAVLALQGLRDAGNLQSGQHVLINGAGGGVGTFAIQYAKLHGAEVTGVDNTGKLDILRAIGADHVIDYTEEDFTVKGIQYDLILDVVGNKSIFRLKRALRNGGAYIMIGGPMSRIITNLLWAPLVSLLERKKIKVLVHKPNHGDQLVWKELVETGQVTPVIDRQYPLHQAAQGLQDLGNGSVQGKAVVCMKL
ncbi:NAD(P)-dependent alcohol dehydrogenase [Paenibacillus tianjinensis]|uniref:NAD(P)-dependent alcohol dehydrogenase n=1 Tax=Paenibacillus tianjinensis TaxID=2810347 RepID=A0ABX7LHG7_9BACL|nr:NAD(P)-dependent alcohol dehydrogenase [Paenibacillus tianjinensis]QSF47436.1 NAD(P)-dependent alcohol dehydrogenase [Paenibacillus tianjinensis]